MKLKDNIKTLRITNNMTLESLASKVGVSKQTIQRYESGTIENIPSDKIELMAKALDTTPAYLMGWHSNTTPAKTNSTEFPNDIRAAARDMMELSEEDKKSAIDMIAYLTHKGKEAKKH